MTRPSLPTQCANPFTEVLHESGNLPAIKYQVLECNGQEILVGRMKVETPTPTGHAFILRRFDTGAVSLTTMFRAAFPTAPEETEKSEVQWVKDNHDLAGNNGSARDPTITRLAGTWVGPQLARTLGASYKIGFLIDAVVQARPDPNVSYRRSAKRDPEPPTTPTPKPVPKSLSAPSPAVPGPGPAKRRKESSPVPSAPPVESSKPPSTRSRRSVRTKSPTPKATSSVIITTTRRSTRRPVEVPSDETAVDEDAPVAAVASEELHDQDVADQRELIAGMMAEREVSRKAVSESPKKSPTKSKIKRSREEEEEELRFDFKEPEVGERAIATNARVGVWQGMAPQNRSFAWGVAAFVFGAGAVAFLPNFL